MNLQGKTSGEIYDLAISLASSLKDQDLNDPETFALVSQLVQILEDKADPLPQDLASDLSEIKDPAERFRQAALKTGATHKDAFERLKRTLQASNLLNKSQTPPPKDLDMNQASSGKTRIKADPHSDLRHYLEFRSALKHADSLSGLEKYQLAKAESNQRIRQIADEYAKKKGLTLNHDIPNHQINPEHSEKIAQAYDQMKHDPSHPEVKRCYQALIDETKDQFRHIRSKGLKISRITPGMDNPYKNGSKDLYYDVHHNNHLWYYPTESGFGSSKEEHSDHPLLQRTGETHDGHPLVANDLFRIVHDYFGHAKEALSFGPKGEDNAWKHHKQMYSPDAQRALTSETRGQNSWVNFGPNGKDNRANPAQTIYAQQKAGLLPSWTMEHPEASASNLVTKARQKLEKHLKNNRSHHPSQDITDSGLQKGQDEFGNPIRGKNKRFQQAKRYGTSSDTFVHVDGKKVKTSDPQSVAVQARSEGKKAVLGSKIPDANGERNSPQRRKMMNDIKAFAEKTHGVQMRVAEGKRDASGEVRDSYDREFDHKPFDVFTAEGAAADKHHQRVVIKEENARRKPLADQAIAKENESRAKAGKKPLPTEHSHPTTKAFLKKQRLHQIKHTDPKPTWGNDFIDTQPSPDAAIHEIAHRMIAPSGMSLKENQTVMDEKWGDYDRDRGKGGYGHLQQKKIADEIQSMATENKLRRVTGLPSNRSYKNPIEMPKVEEARTSEQKNQGKKLSQQIESRPIQQALDNSGPRFVRGKAKSGDRTLSVDFDRQSRLLSPENKATLERRLSGVEKDDPIKGWHPNQGIHAKITARGMSKETVESQSKPFAPNPAPANVELNAARNKKEESQAAQLSRQANAYNKKIEAEKGKEETGQKGKPKAQVPATPEERLAASELRPGMSWADLKKAEDELVMSRSGKRSI